MLSQDELKEALHSALKAANPPCGRQCVAGIERTEHGYRAFHNGVGSVEGDRQTIHAEAPLKFSKDQLSGRLKVWIEGQHRHEMVDLNAALEIDTSGPAMVGWPWHPGEIREIRIDLSLGSAHLRYGVDWDFGDVVTVRGANVGITPHVTTTLIPNVNTIWRWSDGSAP